MKSCCFAGKSSRKPLCMRRGLLDHPTKLSALLPCLFYLFVLFIFSLSARESTRTKNAPSSNTENNEIVSSLPANSYITVLSLFSYCTSMPPHFLIPSESFIVFQDRRILATNLTECRLDAIIDPTPWCRKYLCFISITSVQGHLADMF